MRRMHRNVTKATPDKPVPMWRDAEFFVVDVVLELVEAEVESATAEPVVDGDEVWCPFIPP